MNFKLGGFNYVFYFWNGVLMFLICKSWYLFIVYCMLGIVMCV